MPRSISETSASSAPSAPATDRPQLKRIRVRAERDGAFRTRLAVRSFRFATDEPTGVGGSDQAPTPMEYFVAALEGCLAVVVETVAHEQGREIIRLSSQAVATMDRRGFAGVEGVRPHFTDLRVEVTVGVTGDPELNAALIEQTERRCPVVNLIRDAAVDVEVTWTFEPGAGTGARR